MIQKDYHEFGKHVTRQSDEPQLFALLSSMFSKERQPLGSEPENLRYTLQRLGFSKPQIAKWLEASKAHGSSLDDEILTQSGVDEDAYYGALARYLRLPLETQIDKAAIHYTADLDRQLTTPRVLRLHPKTSAPKLLIVPSLGHLKAIAKILEHQPHLRNNLVVTTRSALREAIWSSGSDNRLHRARFELSETQPLQSARNILHGKQGWLFGLVIGAAAIALLNPDTYLFLALHLFCSTFYLLANALRMSALVPRFRLWRRDKSLIAEGTTPPIYSILVPLHREKEVIPQLLSSLDAIQWPRSRLDIKLICEADDHETLSALDEQRLTREYQIVRVPPSEPRTKPKALQYAMPSVRGQYLTIYDAEDRPHPQQLQEAFTRFQRGGTRLACLQAPLIITNISRSWLSALFAAEYAALFRRILPMLATLKLPLPLGGTSNHFKTDVLRLAGGWDPFNVAEDADLGMRLSRMGYEIGVLDRPTLEDAPTSGNIWMKQRMRWYKGWLVTWLVMMREPWQVIHQFGALRFVAAQLMIGGLLLSSLSHPLILGFIVITLYHSFFAGMSDLQSYQTYLLFMDGFNIVGSYIVFWLLSQSALTPLERLRMGPRWLLTPIYWVMLSIAAWRAVFELKTHPFRWNKTPHEPSR